MALSFVAFVSLGVRLSHSISLCDMSNVLYVIYWLFVQRLAFHLFILSLRTQPAFVSSIHRSRTVCLRPFSTFLIMMVLGGRLDEILLDLNEVHPVSLHLGGYQVGHNIYSIYIIKSLFRLFFPVSIRDMARLLSRNHSNK
jgi:hypothetical protein